MSYNRQITINCTNSPSAECTVEAALSIIGGKWKLKIYKVLKNGVPQRYSSLGKAIADISEKTLAAQLKEMERDGIVTRVVFAEIPPRVEYELTTLGKSLETIYNSLDSWGKEYISQKR